MWFENSGPDPIPHGLLDRIMFLGQPTTAADGTHRSVTADGPQAHLAVQGAATGTLPTHFHGVEQFQLFVRGTGMVGRHAVRPGVVHYSDRHTVYGPLRPGPGGMAYATLRVRHDPGANFMPAARQRLADLLAEDTRSADRRRRNITFDLRTMAEGVDPDGIASWVDLYGDRDGLRIAIVNVRAGFPSDPLRVSGAGAYITVVDGALDDRGAVRGPGAFCWLDPGSAFRAIAAQPGARLALLQFPPLPHSVR